MKRLSVFLAALLLSPAASAAQSPAGPVPILFVHGFCSSADTWSTMTPALSTIDPARYGTAVTRLSAGVTLSAQDGARKMFAIDFRGAGGAIDPLATAQVSIANKAVELKQVIDEIKRVTGQPKVIVVGHSLGGLAARWYIQRGAGTTPYTGDVAALATIDTPHLGSSLAAFDDRALELDTFLQCLLLPSVNRTELVPGSTSLTTLNATPWRTDTPAASIASWQAEFTNPRTDGIVLYESQNLLSVYPQLSGTSVFLLDNPVSLGPAQQILHLLVNQRPSTIGLVHLVVSAVDRLTPTAARPGAPQLTAAASGTSVALSWTPSSTGGAPAAYVLRGTYRNLQGAVTPFDFPVGSATSILVPVNLTGAFTVRVHAINSAGESAPSNEVTFSVPVSTP